MANEDVEKQKHTRSLHKETTQHKTMSNGFTNTHYDALSAIASDWATEIKQHRRTEPEEEEREKEQEDERRHRNSGDAMHTFFLGNAPGSDTPENSTGSTPWCCWRRTKTHHDK